MTTDSTTTTTPPTAEQRLAAHGRADELYTTLNGMTDAERRAWPERIKALVEQISEQDKIRYARESAAPPAGPTWQERQQHRDAQRVLRSELLTHTVQNTPEAEAVIDDIIAEHATFDGKRPAPTTPGTHTWSDFDHTPSVQDWTPEQRAISRTWSEAVGLSPMEAIALAGHWPGADVATRPLVDWRARWGDAFAEKHAHVERALRVLGDDTYNQLRAFGVGNVGTEALVEQLAAIGARLATR